MFDSIYLPVDNSDYSNACVDIGLELAQKFGSRIVASHVYAAKMHDVHAVVNCRVFPCNQGEATFKRLMFMQIRNQPFCV